MNTVPGPGSPPGSESAPVEGKKKTPKEASGNGKPKVPRPRLNKFPEEHVITVLRPNAKTGKSADRYNVYQDGMTIKQYIETMTKDPWNRTPGQVWADLRWDTDANRRLINVGQTVVEKPPAPPPKEPKPKKKKLEVVQETSPQPAS